MHVLWSGSLQFGHLDISVKLVSSEQSGGIDFHALHSQCSAQVSRGKWRPEHGVVAEEEIDLGIELGDGRFLKVEDEDFNLAMGNSGRTFAIAQFAKRDAIDPAYFRDSFYIIPNEGFTKSYQILHDAVQKANCFGIGHIQLEKRYYPAGIWANESILTLTTLKYSHEVPGARDALKIPPHEKPNQLEIAKVEKLIAQNTQTSFIPPPDDSFQDRLLLLLSRRVVELESRNVFSLPIPEELLNAQLLKPTTSSRRRGMEKASLHQRSAKKRAS